MVSKEFKNYEFRGCPRPLTTGRYRLVSNTVQVFGAGHPGIFYCYVAFSDKFVAAVGKKLRGVMSDNPAVLWVSVNTDGTYTLGASLFRPPVSGVILWSAPYVEGTPEWLKLHKVRHNGNSPTGAREGKASGRSNPQRKSGEPS